MSESARNDRVGVEAVWEPIPARPQPRGPVRRATTRLAARLVADRRATEDAVVEAPAPVRPIDLADDARVTEVLELAEQVGEVALAAGTAVMDTSTRIEFIAATYGLARCDIDVTYNSIRISADRGPALPPAGTMRVVRYRSLDFTRLAAVDRLTRRVRRELVPVADARDTLDAIVTAPHPYSRWVAAGGWALLAASIALLLGGDLVVAAVSFAGTTLIYRANRVMNRRSLPFFFQNVIGGVIAAAPAVLLATFAGRLDVNPSLIVAAGITALLSGAQLVGSVEDALTGAPITAAARMLEVLMLTGGIIAGIALTLRVADMLHAVTPPIDMSPARDATDLPLEIAAGAIAAAAFALACYAERQALAVAGLSGAAATVCCLLPLRIGFGPVVSTGFAATVVGLAGGLMARRALTPPLVVAMAGIVPLLPGLRVYRGLAALLNSDLLNGFSQLLSAFSVGCALAAGVTLGEWCARELRRPRIVQRFHGIRRPQLIRRSGWPRRPHFR
ncbi:threonine/serine ThrE exporter family protein [Nocardia sp. alder85J]|uniref:threonine/serine ThrE exporter family protein n=1 Tax=Nocardia sp. alder85J TaxID=2862949 RepID=UPI001CD4CF74|nr:threonine/serine exporter family protein [Nocardia sp. alder85J]MCX4096472.1 threonine/serine exporter family protein [Nocardia sp. alder85J]